MADFKEKVAGLVQWFEKYQDQLRNLMDAGNLKDASELAAPQVKKVMGDLPFQIYKNPRTGRYALEFMTLMDDSKKIVCFYVCDALAAKIKNKWDFFYYHPATRGTINFGGKDYSPADVKLVPNLNKDTRKIDIVVSNKDAFKGMKDSDRFMLIYMLLCDYLGEICVDAYVGAISFGRPRLFMSYKPSNEVPLDNLYKFFELTAAEQGWVKPSEIKLIASNFKSKRTKNVEPRQDFMEGMSYCVELLNEEGTPNPFLANYIKSLGVGIYSVCTKKDLVDDKKAKAVKDRVEKKLSGILNKGKDGFLLHSITGNVYVYADFMAFDEKVAETVRREIVDAEPDCKLLEL